VIVRASDRAAIDAATTAARRADGRIFARTRPLVDNIAPRVRSSRVAAILAGTLGGLALVLASVGMFGVFAYWVQQRTREIGVRMALGARGIEVVTLVLRASAWTIVVGGFTGAAGAVAASGLLRSYLFGLSPIDPAAYIGVVVLLAVSATFATYIPARRATRIDPVVALRAE
jgi:putative ABC transport system permease protein